MDFLSWIFFADRCHLAAKDHVLLSNIPCLSVGFWRPPYAQALKHIHILQRWRPFEKRKVNGVHPW